MRAIYKMLTNGQAPFPSRDVSATEEKTSLVRRVMLAKLLS